jgi:hypothetical protein
MDTLRRLLIEKLMGAGKAFPRGLLGSATFGISADIPFAVFAREVPILVKHLKTANNIPAYFDCANERKHLLPGMHRYRKMHLPIGGKHPRKPADQPQPLKDTLDLSLALLGDHHIHGC